jgi:hypothetical protein
MKPFLISLAMLAFALTEASAADADTEARMSHVVVDCSTFVKFRSNWVAHRDTTIFVKTDSRSDSALPLTKGTSVTGLLTYGIYLEDVLENRCPRK